MDARRLGSKACTALLKTLLLIFNLMFLLLGIFLLAIGIYGMTVTNVLFITFAAKNTIYLPFVIIGLFMVFVGSLSLWCTPKGVTWLLYLYGMIIFVLFVVVFTLSALLVVRHDAVERSLKDGITNSMNNYEKDQVAMDNLQTTLQCCGLANYTDWDRTTWFTKSQSIPLSCCRNQTNCHNKWPISDTTDIFERGCYQLLEAKIEQYYAAIGGIGFACSIVIFFGSILACSLSRNIQTNRYQQLE